MLYSGSSEVVAVQVVDAASLLAVMGSVHASHLGWSV
jgi:hypothetical protein